VLAIAGAGRGSVRQGAWHAARELRRRRAILRRRARAAALRAAARDDRRV